jgi:hypothetical protein
MNMLFERIVEYLCSGRQIICINFLLRLCVVLPVTRGMWIPVLQSSFGIFITSSFEFALHSTPHKWKIIMIGHRAAHVGRGTGR